MEDTFDDLSDDLDETPKKKKKKKSLMFKVVLLGEGRVGKTSVCTRYCQGNFDAGQISTIATGYLEKRVDTGNHVVRLNIYDTAGQERFHSLAPIYYRGAQGALLVYDITDQDSFERVARWVSELRTMADKNITMCIIANKCDMEDKRQVDKEAAEAYAKEVGAVHVLGSAKTAMGIESAFFQLIQRMVRAADLPAAQTACDGPLLALERPPPPHSKGCCRS